MELVTGYLAGDPTMLYYIAPTGEMLHLSGMKPLGQPGFWLGSGPDGLGHVDVKAVWDAAAIDEGEDYVGYSVDHMELDLPIHILGTSNSDFQRRKEWLKSLMPRDRQGFLAAYQNALGWRWVATRLGSFKPAYGSDPANARGATFDTILLVDKPHARVANSTAEWKYEGVPGGSLFLYPGDAVDGWPVLIFTGPGQLRLIYDGVDDARVTRSVDVTIPVSIGVGREVFIDTDMAHQTIRERASQSADRGVSLWQKMRNRYFPFPIRKGQVTRIRFEITGAGSGTRLWATVPRRHEGLL